MEISKFIGAADSCESDADKPVKDSEKRPTLYTLFGIPLTVTAEAPLDHIVMHPLQFVEIEWAFMDANRANNPNNPNWKNRG
jgi:hypothetical protein